MSTPRQIAARLHALSRNVDRELARELDDLAGDVVQLTRGETHVISGDLRDSLSAWGPYPTEGGMAVTITPAGIPYADAEAMRGGEHQFAERGLTASGPRIEQSARNLERAIARAIEGR